MCLKNLMLIVIFLPTVLISTSFAEEPLELSSTEGSYSVGHDQNMLGINSYNKKKFGQALKHFQTASVVDRKKGEISSISA